MKSTAAALMLIVCATSARASCDSSKTQTDLSICAGREYKAADSDLTHAYALAIANARRAGPSQEERLRKAQRAWIPFRDLACAAEGGQREGGSMEGMVIAMCLTRLTKERTRDLLIYASDDY